MLNSGLGTPHFRWTEWFTWGVMLVISLMRRMCNRKMRSLQSFKDLLYIQSNTTQQLAAPTPHLQLQSEPQLQTQLKLWHIDIILSDFRSPMRTYDSSLFPLFSKTGCLPTLEQKLVLVAAWKAQENKYQNENKQYEVLSGLLNRPSMWTACIASQTRGIFRVFYLFWFSLWV